MTLKESFQYQNHLEHLLDCAITQLAIPERVHKTTRRHMRSKVNPAALDEDEIVVPSQTLPCEVDCLIDYLITVLSEKDRLSKAIAAAKATAPKNIDVEIAINSARRDIVGTLKRLCRKLPPPQKTNGIDYTFNAEGNQVAYQYPIVETSVPAYDMERVKGIVRTLAALTNETSTAIDAVIVNTQFEFRPLFSVTDTFEDSVEGYAATHKPQ